MGSSLDTSNLLVNTLKPSHREMSVFIVNNRTGTSIHFIQSNGSFWPLTSIQFHLFACISIFRVRNVFFFFFNNPMLYACRGYLAPEYAMRARLTRKADIYSFGVLLLEIVSGRCNTNKRLPVGDQFLLERV